MPREAKRDPSQWRKEEEEAGSEFWGFGERRDFFPYFSRGCLIASLRCCCGDDIWRRRRYFVGTNLVHLFGVIFGRLV